MREGPLAGARVLEFGGMGPGPYAAMLLGDLGADVLRIDRPGAEVTPSARVTNRSGQRIELDLKSPADRETVLSLAGKADLLIEGFRPGVMERLGLGPGACLARNPALIYGRITGWGQDGPLAQVAGHDINYIALSGALAAIGPAEAPVPPLNLVGDYGGGGALFALALVAALCEARRSGLGQVVDHAMSQGASNLMAPLFGRLAAGQMVVERQANLLDGGAPFYGCYQCADGRWIAVGAIEPPFYSALLRLIGLAEAEFQPQHDRRRWPEWRARFAAVFRSRSRDEWTALLEHSDACLSPVLDMVEAPGHPHNRTRGAFVQLDGTVQPGPSSRFSRTPVRLAGKVPLGQAAALAWFTRETEEEDTR